MHFILYPMFLLIILTSVILFMQFVRDQLLCFLVPIMHLAAKYKPGLERVQACTR